MLNTVGSEEVWLARFGLEIVKRKSGTPRIMGSRRRRRQSSEG